MTRDQDLARELGETLHRRADGLHDTPLDLGDVRGRALAIRRRRRAAVALAAAGAVAAVVLPVALLPTGGEDRVRDPEPVETPTTIEDPVPLDPRSAPAGEPARVAYVEVDARRLVTPAGTYDLPEAYPQIVPYLDGWVALTRGTPGLTGTRVTILDSDFAETDRTEAATGIAVRDGGDRVAWVEYTGDGWTLVNAPTAGAAPTYTQVSTSGEAARSTAVGFLPGDQVVVETLDPQTFDNAYRVVAPDRTTTAQFDGFTDVVSASPVTGLVAGQTQFLGDGSCSGVLDPLSSSQRLVWETCDHQLGAFGPDGRYVVGLAAYSDANGSPSVAILDARTGEPVVDFRSSRDPAAAATVTDAVWEDATTLVATVDQGGEEHLVRLGVDGRTERLESVDDPGGENARFWFAGASFW